MSMTRATSLRTHGLATTAWRWRGRNLRCCTQSSRLANEIREALHVVNARRHDPQCQHPSNERSTKSRKNDDRFHGREIGAFTALIHSQVPSMCNSLCTLRHSCRFR